MLTSRYLRNTLISGVISAATSALAGLVCSRIENRRAAPALNAISHIAWGGAPPAEGGAGGRNTMVGIGLHAGASVFWASFFEALLGRRARRSVPAALLSGSVIAAGAYVTDYHVVHRRFRPGFEAYLSGRSMFAVYAALAAGFALAALAPKKND